MDDIMHVERHGHVFEMRLDRPKANAIDAATSQETYFTDAASYTTSTTDLETVGFNSSSNVTMGAIVADATGYCMLATASGGSQTWVYDSGDVFSLDAGGTDVATTVTGVTEAAFETENASLTALTTDMTISYRTGATTSGISYFITGT